MKVRLREGELLLGQDLLHCKGLYFFCCYHYTLNEREPVEGGKELVCVCACACVRVCTVIEGQIDGRKRPSLTTCYPLARRLARSVQWALVSLLGIC